MSNLCFENYLQQKGLSVATVQCYTKYCNRFLQWLEVENADTETFNYNELLEFISHQQQKGIHTKTLNMVLSVVRHYGNYLIATRKRNDNPAMGIFIKGIFKTVPVNLLSIEALEDLYRQYNGYTRATTARKIILGLLICQGLKSGELRRLQSHDIQLQTGTVFIRATKRSNERKLHLQAVQIPLLQSFLQKSKAKGNKTLIAAELLSSNQMYSLFQQLKRIHANVTNPKQIRNSVLTFWLQQNNLRQVQYMAGHKYVSSTERYQNNRLEDLQKALQEHHPFR